MYSYKPLIRNHLSKNCNHRVVILCSILCVSVSFQGRIMFADLLAVEGMKNLIMWSCSFRWVRRFPSPSCPVEMAPQGRIYSERIRPSTGVETLLYIESGWMGNSEKRWRCCDIPWDSSSCQDALGYFIPLLFCLRWLSVNFLGKALNSECSQELPTISCSSGSCSKYLLLRSVLQHSKYVSCIRAQSVAGASGVTPAVESSLWKGAISGSPTSAELSSSLASAAKVFSTV